MTYNEEGKKSLMKGILATNQKEKAKSSKRISWGGMNVQEYQKENGNNTEGNLRLLVIEDKELKNQASVGNIFVEKSKLVDLNNQNKQSNINNTQQTNYYDFKKKYIDSNYNEISNNDKNKQIQAHKIDKQE